MRYAIIVATLLFCGLGLETVRAQDASLPPSATSYEDWWWNANQSGHGLNIGQQGNVLFVSWFTYDDDGSPLWLTMTGTLSQRTVTGNWLRTTGPALGTPFDPSRVTGTVVGTGTLRFASDHAATLTWTVNGKSGTLALTRTTWATPMPAAGIYQGHVLWHRSGGCTVLNSIVLPTQQTIALFGNRVVVTERFTGGTRNCVMTGNLVASGSVIAVEGTFNCVTPNETGLWTGTWSVHPNYLVREETLTIDVSGCVIQQSSVDVPIPPDQP